MAVFQSNLSRLRPWRPPARWAVCYLLAVPTFAFLYATLPARSLHDANITYEDSVARDATRLLTELSASIKPAPNAVWRSGANSERLVSGSVRLTAIRRPVEGHILVALAGDAIGTSVPITEDHFVEHLQIITEEHLDEAAGRAYRVSYLIVLADPFSGMPLTNRPRDDAPVDLLFPEPSGYGGGSPTSGLFTLTPPVNKQFITFFNAQEGDPYAGSERFLRMLYLSGTTITTLGLGDITPVSGRARAYVWIEALIGLILIGLFLNDLAHIAARRHT